jgi:ABC-type sugar transport system ATPase subunit
MTTLTLNHVSKRFAAPVEGGHAIAAIDHVSFKLNNGEILAILGPSGCGKSTLLRVIAGLILPDSGEVLYDNVNLQAIPLDERGIGMVFQEGALPPHWAAKRSIGFFLWLRQREDEVPERIRRISQITGFGLDALLDRRPSQLSGGERQRIGIARALARDPRLFLFDEPFSNIDARLRTRSRHELRKLLTEFPVTSVYVTHDQVEAVALASRIAVMDAGRLIQMGSYETLHDNPTNIFVATFIGTPTINLLEGRARDHYWQGKHFGGLPLRGDLLNDTPVTLGIRPSFIHLASETTPGAASAVVNSVTPFFAERFQLVEAFADSERFTLSVSPDMSIQKGEIIHCTLDRAGALFFDTRSGMRIG